jgi:hypothetical protein
MPTIESITKQLHINRISLPCDILNEIKGFCFYDSITGKTRIQKAEIVKNINKSFTSGIGDKWFQQEDDPDLFLYAFSKLHSPYQLNCIQLQIRFCMCCGGYLHCSTYKQMENLIERVKCSCVVNDQFQQGDHYHYL